MQVSIEVTVIVGLVCLVIGGPVMSVIKSALDNLVNKND